MAPGKLTSSYDQLVSLVVRFHGLYLLSVMPGLALPSQVKLLSSTPESERIGDSGVYDEGVFRKQASKDAV